LDIEYESAVRSGLRDGDGVSLGIEQDNVESGYRFGIHAVHYLAAESL